VRVPTFELAIIVDPRETAMASEEPKAISDYRIVYENGKRLFLRKSKRKETEAGSEKTLATSTRNALTHILSDFLPYSVQFFSFRS
jgi:hypothetical protein